MALPCSHSTQRLRGVGTAHPLLSHQSCLLYGDSATADLVRFDLDLGTGAIRPHSRVVAWSGDPTGMLGKLQFENLFCCIAHKLDPLLVFLF